MANFSEQVVNLWEEWVAETGYESADPGEFVDWALSNRRLVPNPVDVKQMLRRQDSQHAQGGPCLPCVAGNG